MYGRRNGDEGLGLSLKAGIQQALTKKNAEAAARLEAQNAERKRLLDARDAEAALLNRAAVQRAEPQPAYSAPLPPVQSQPVYTQPSATFSPMPAAEVAPPVAQPIPGGSGLPGWLIPAGLGLLLLMSSKGGR